MKEHGRLVKSMTICTNHIQTHHNACMRVSHWESANSLSFSLNTTADMQHTRAHTMFTRSIKYTRARKSVSKRDARHCSFSRKKYSWLNQRQFHAHGKWHRNCFDMGARGADRRTHTHTYTHTYTYIHTRSEFFFPYHFLPASSERAVSSCEQVAKPNA